MTHEGQDNIPKHFCQYDRVKSYAIRQALRPFEGCMCLCCYPYLSLSPVLPAPVGAFPRHHIIGPSIVPNNSAPWRQALGGQLWVSPSPSHSISWLTTNPFNWPLNPPIYCCMFGCTRPGQVCTPLGKTHPGWSPNLSWTDFYLFLINKRKGERTKRKERKKTH